MSFAFYNFFKQTNYWYLRSYEPFSINESSRKFEINQKRQPKIAINDSVILIYKSNFIAYGIIKNAPGGNADENNITEGHYVYEIGGLSEITPPNDLLGFAYSLPKVYKYFDKPHYHFNRVYGRLSKFEYETIINHDYFISRTAFGRIINSLHPQHRSSFLKYFALQDSILLFAEHKDYSQIFELLLTYIQSSIILQADVLKKTQYIINNDLKLTQDIGFGDPNSDKVLLIRRQVKRINDAEDNINGFNLDFILSGIQKIYREEGLKNKEFRDSSLPINF